MSTKRSLILVFILSLNVFLYAQNETEYKEESGLSCEKKSKIFLDFINQKAYASTIEKDEEKKILREKWEEVFRIDIFYPYFKKRELEEWIGQKTKTEFFKIKGRAKFEEDEIKYIFKIKF